MSNYLQSRWLYSIVSIALLSSQTAIIVPTIASPAKIVEPTKIEQVPSQQKQAYQAIPVKQSWESEQNYSDKLLKNLSVEKFDNSLKENSDALSSLRDKFIRGIGGLIYDPVHPEQLLERLITGYDFYLFLHRELISYAENLLGSQNQMVIEAKQNYREHVAYLEALKQQKQLIEQSKGYKQ